MATTHLVTADDLLAFGSDNRHELVEGVLREVSPSGYKSNLVVNNVNFALYQFVRKRRLGYVSVAEGGYILGRNPDTVVAPDVAFVGKDRVPEGIPDRGFLPIRPDLVVEVISPTDEPAEIRAKQELYDRYEVPLVWWIDPLKRTATVYRLGHPAQVMEQSGTLDGANVLPGFSLSLAEIFED